MNGYGILPGTVQQESPVRYGILPGTVQQDTPPAGYYGIAPGSFQHDHPPHSYAGPAAVAPPPPPPPPPPLAQGYRRDDLQRDFVARRYRASRPPALPNQPQPSPSDSCTPWLGVSDLERLLVSCCSREGDDGESNEEAASTGGERRSLSEEEPSSSIRVRGALDQDLVLRFVAALAQHCHDLASRALALAILERSLEQDELDDEAADDEQALEADNRLLDFTSGPSVSSAGAREGEDGAAPQASEDDGALSEEPPAKRQKTEEPIGEVEEARTSERGDKSRRRVHEFLAAGGMKILNQWLVDAATPVKKPTAPAGGVPAAAVAARPRHQPTERRASPTGPILVPLLRFLASAPFDKQLIRKSKINKQIRELSREVDGLASGAQVTDSTTHVASGGLPIRQVKGEVDRLKDVWEEKAKKGSSKSDRQAFANPFEQLQRQLAERLGVLEAHSRGDANRGGSDKPEWLAKVEEQQRAKEKKKAGKSAKVRTAASTADLARRERENERAALMREDLQRAQEQRRQLVIRLRELKQKSMQEERKARHSKSKRSIRWKDGEGSSSRAKKRDMLEEVFIIPGRGSTGDGDEDGVPSANDEDLDLEDVIEILDQ